MSWVPAYDSMPVFTRQYVFSRPKHPVRLYLLALRELCRLWLTSGENEVFGNIGGPWHVRRKTLMLVAAAFLIPGAYAASIHNNTQAAARTAAIETVVATDVDATWNALVSGLNNRDFEINTLIKKDRTIKVLVKSETPSKYVDCGEISISSKHPVFGDRNYSFAAANSARYLVADESAGELVDVERRTSLNALANIQLSPLRQGTLVRVDALYVMTFRTREFGTNISARSLDDRLDFDSSGRASRDEQIREGAHTKIVTVECQPTGDLERRIVAVLGRAAG